MPINLLYRESSTQTPPSETSVKGGPLTNAEIDANFKSISNANDTLQSNLNTVESNLKSDDATLQSNIDTVQSNVDTVQSNLDTVESNLKADDATLQSNINTKAPISHAVNANTYGLGTASVYGHVKISDSGTSAASSSVAASPKYVDDTKTSLESLVSSTQSTLQGNIDTKAPISHAVNANTYGLGTASVYGHVKIADSGTSAASSSVAASPKLVSDSCTAIQTSLESDLDALIKEYS